MITEIERTELLIRRLVIFLFLGIFSFPQFAIAREEILFKPNGQIPVVRQIDEIDRTEIMLGSFIDKKNRIFKDARLRMLDTEVMPLRVETGGV